MPKPIKRDGTNGRNIVEVMAHRFGLSNADCLADPRVGRLIKYKISLETKVTSARAVDVRPLGTAAGFSLDELASLDPRVLRVLKSIRDSQRFLTVLCPKKKQPTKEKVNA